MKLKSKILTCIALTILCSSITPRSLAMFGVQKNKPLPAPRDRSGVAAHVDAQETKPNADFFMITDKALLPTRLSSLNMRIIAGNNKLVLQFISEANISTLHEKDRNGYTLLNTAVDIGNYEVVQALVNRGVNVNQVDAFRLSPLKLAMIRAEDNNREEFKIIIDILTKNHALPLNKGRPDKVYTLEVLPHLTFPPFTPAAHTPSASSSMPTDSSSMSVESLLMSSDSSSMSVDSPFMSSDSDFMS